MQDYKIPEWITQLCRNCKNSPGLCALSNTTIHSVRNQYIFKKGNYLSIELEEQPGKSTIVMQYTSSKGDN